MTPAVASPRLVDIAVRIRAHLARFEADPKVNLRKGGEMGLRLYYYTNAYSVGCKIAVVYITYQSRTCLTKAEALEYLAWLDAGNVGRHYEQQRQASAER